MCKFCEYYEYMKLWYKNHYREGRKNDYSAALITRSWFKEYGSKRASTITSRRYSLNYCPECGKPLKRRKNVKKDSHVELN